MLTWFVLYSLFNLFTANHACFASSCCSLLVLLAWLCFDYLVPGRLLNMAWLAFNLLRFGRLGWANFAWLCSCSVCFDLFFSAFLINSSTLQWWFTKFARWLAPMTRAWPTFYQLSMKLTWPNFIKNSIYKEILCKIEVEHDFFGGLSNRVTLKFSWKPSNFIEFRIPYDFAIAS